MAAALQKLRLGVICAVIVYSTFNQVTNASDTTKNCNETVTKFQSCWDWHHTLPIECTNASTTSLVKCGVIEKYGLQECDKDGSYDFGWESIHRQKLYTDAMEILCYESNLHKDFKEDENCWKQARDCATPIIQIPKEATEADCQRVTATVNDCKSKEHNPYRSNKCSNMINIYVDRLFEKTKFCGASTFFVHISLILIASLFALSTT